MFPSLPLEDGGLRPDVDEDRQGHPRKPVYTRRPGRSEPERVALCRNGTGSLCLVRQGDNWQPLQTNLPVTPVHDLAIQAREKDLVAATHGRSFWILDDLTPLYQMNDEIARSDVYLYQPRETYRMGGFTFDRPGLAIGKNPPNGVVVPYYFRHKPGEKDSIRLEFLDGKGAVIRSFTHREEIGRA